MVTAMEELNQLNTEDQNESPESRPSMKEEMMSALQEMKAQERKAAEQEQKAQNLEKIQRKQALERQEMNEVYKEVQEAYKEEITKDPSFQKVLSEKDLSGDILEYIMEIGDANDALLLFESLLAMMNIKRSGRKHKHLLAGVV